MSWGVFSAFHWSPGAAGSCASSRSFWSGSGGDKIRTRTKYHSARVCLESVVWVSSSRKTFVDSRDIPGARWSRHWWVVACVMVLRRLLLIRYPVVLRCASTSSKKKQKEKRNKRKVWVRSRRLARMRTRAFGSLVKFESCTNILFFFELFFFFEKWIGK